MKLILPIISIISSIVVLIRDWKYYDRRTKKHRYINKIVIGIFILSGLLTLWVNWQDSKESSKLKKDINGLIDGNRKLNKDLEEKTKKIIELNEKKCKDF